MTEVELKPRETMETCSEPPAESIDNNNKPDKAAEQENPPIIAVEKSSEDTSILNNVPVKNVNDSTQENNIPSKPVLDDDKSATSKPAVNDVSKTVINKPSNVSESVEIEPSNNVNVTSTSSDSNAFNVNHENPSKQTTIETTLSEQLTVNTNPSNEQAINSDSNIIESKGVNLQESGSSSVVDSNHESQSKDQDHPTESNTFTESLPIPTTTVVEDSKTTSTMELSISDTVTTNTSSTPLELTTVVTTSPMDSTETSSTMELSTVSTTSPLELTTTPNVLTIDAPVVCTTSMDLTTTSTPLALPRVTSPLELTVASPVVSAMRTIPTQTIPNSSQTKPISQQSLSAVVAGSSSNKGISTATNTTTTFLPQHAVTTLSPPLRPQFTTRTTFVPQSTASSINSSQIIPQHSTQSTAVQTHQQHSIRRTSAPQHHNNTTTITTANGEVAQLMNIPPDFLSSGGPILLSRNGQVISTSGAGSAMLQNTSTQHIIVQDEANNVISIPEESFPQSLNGFSGGTIKLENGSYLRIPGTPAGNGGKFHISPSGQIVSSGNGITLASSNNDANVISIPEPPQVTSQLPTAPHPIKIEPTNGMTARPPNTELLLKTAKSMLQLPDEEPPMAVEQTEYKRGVFSGSILEVDESGTILSTTTAPEAEEYAITDTVQEMEVEENATYILESVDGGEQLYAENPNIMWIEETVEVEQEANGGGQENMVIILNPNGTINEELMLANGFNMETIKALSEAMGGGLGGGEGNEAITEPVLPPPPSLPPPPPPSSTHQQHLGVGTSLSSSVSSIHSGITSITSLQHPIPKKLLAGVEPIMNTTSLPPGVLASVGKIEPGLQPVHQPVHSLHQSIHHPAHSVHHPAHSVHHPLQQSEQRFIRFTDAKEECMLLDDVKDPLLTQQGLSQQLHGKIVSINGQHHLITASNKPMPNLRRITDSQNLVTPLGTLDLRVGKREDSFNQYIVNPSHLIPDSSVLKVLDQSDLLKGKRGSGDGSQGPPKVKRQRIKDENGNGTYLNRKTTSLGALGQALHGIPRDSRENAVQICPICKFQATTKNPYRHLQDHLARVHFKDRIAAELPTKKPYTCPFQGCDGKQYPDWQAVMRHYIGKKHGILDKYVRETIAETGIKLPEQYIVNNMGLAAM